MPQLTCQANAPVDAPIQQPFSVWATLGTETTEAVDVNWIELKQRDLVNNRDEAVSHSPDPDWVYPSAMRVDNSRSLAKGHGDLWWYTEIPSLIFIPHGPMTKSYRYTWTVQPVPGYGNAVSDTKDVRIYVPAHKIAAGWAANGHYAAAAWMAAAACTPWTWWMAALAAVQTGLGIAQAMIAMDPIEYDPKYDEDHDYRKLLPSCRHDDGAPASLRSFRDSAAEVIALSQSIVVTRARHASALRDGQQALATEQRRSSRDKLTRSRQAIRKLQEQVPAVMQYAADRPLLRRGASRGSGGGPFTKNEWTETLNRVTKSGFSAEEKERLLANGFTESTIAGLESKVQGRAPRELTDIARERGADIHTLLATAKVRPITASDIPEDVSDEVAELGSHVADLHTKVALESEEIERTHELTGNALLRDLHHSGVMERTEFEAKKNHLDNEDDYLLTEIDAVGPAASARLARMGIETTGQLLAACAEPSDRALLAEQVGVEPEVVDEWVSYADLMRVSGVGQHEARLLRSADIEDTRKLAAAKAPTLYGALRDQAHATQWQGKRLTPDKIKRWKDRASRM